METITVNINSNAADLTTLLQAVSDAQETLATALAAVAAFQLTFTVGEVPPATA